jgi:hypothetical protein
MGLIINSKDDKKISPRLIRLLAEVLNGHQKYTLFHAKVQK